MSKSYYRVHEIAELLKVSPTTIRRYVKEGKLQCDHTMSGQRVFTEEQVSEFLGDTNDKMRVKAYYCRSSDGDKKKISSQRDLLVSTFGDLGDGYFISDNSSGLNDQRKGLKRLIKLAQDGKITDIYFTQKDRLTRFGYSYLEVLFEQNNVQLHYASDTSELSLQEELLNDFMSLVASFSGKFYRLRGYEQQKQLLNKTKDTIDEKQNAQRD